MQFWCAWVLHKAGCPTPSKIWPSRSPGVEGDMECNRNYSGLFGWWWLCQTVERWASALNQHHCYFIVTLFGQQTTLKTGSAYPYWSQMECHPFLVQCSLLNSNLQVIAPHTRVDHHTRQRTQIGKSSEIVYSHSPQDVSTCMYICVIALMPCSLVCISVYLLGYIYTSLVQYVLGCTCRYMYSQLDHYIAFVDNVVQRVANWSCIEQTNKQFRIK